MKIGTIYRIAAASASRRATANMRRLKDRFTYQRTWDGGTIVTDTITGATQTLKPHGDKSHARLIEGDKKENKHG